MQSTITLKQQSGVATITLNRPEVMNAINMQMRTELQQALSDLRHQSDIKVVILTGGGPTAFCAGMDLKEFWQSRKQQTTTEQRRFRWDQTEGITQFDKPIIAAINGLAIGGGVELALLCDICLASTDASFAFGEVKRGLIPGNGGTQRLARRIGKARALEMILTGNSINAAQALAYGLIEYITPAEQLIEKTMELAQAIAANAPIAVRTAKAAIHRGIDLPIEQALQLERDLATLIYTTEDSQEGPQAFIEKRSPTWHDR